MAEINLKKLNRRDLLELLLEARRENERLQREVDELREKNEHMDLVFEEVGSISDASLQLSGVFEAAQRAADLYIKNVQLTYQEQEQETERLREEIGRMDAILEDKRRQSREIEDETREYCEELMRRAQAQARRIMADAREQAAGR